MESISKPERPVFNRGLIGYIVLAIVLFSWLMLYAPTTYGDEPKIWEWILELFVFVCIPLFIYLPLYNKQTRDYILACKDFEAYRRQIIREQDAAAASAQEALAARAIEEAMKPECPYCHSHDTMKITTTAKVVNIAMFGLFGQKRMYQWHCNKCKSNF